MVIFRKKSDLWEGKKVEGEKKWHQKQQLLNFDFNLGPTGVNAQSFDLTNFETIFI